MRSKHTKYESRRILGCYLYEWALKQIAEWNSDECLIWTHATNEHGYGMVTTPWGQHTKIHRVAFFVTHGRWPTPFALHTCDNPPCYNPRHLVEGNQFDNMGDCARKLRGNHGINNGMAKLDDETVKQIWYRYHEGYTYEEVGREFGVNKVTVGDIIKRGAWKHVIQAIHQRDHI